MASYRDKYNPEALHFPGSVASKTFLAVILFVCLLLVVWAVWSGEPLEKALYTLLALAVAAMAVAAWPKSILLDQDGLVQHHGSGKRQLAWKEIGAVEVTSEFGLPMRSGRFATQALRVRSSEGKVRVVHTPRHTDFQRFTFELQRHGVKLPEELGHITAPNLSRLTSAKEPMPEGLRRREP